MCRSKPWGRIPLIGYSRSTGTHCDIPSGGERDNRLEIVKAAPRAPNKNGRFLSIGSSTSVQADTTLTDCVRILPVIRVRIISWIVVSFPRYVSTVCAISSSFDCGATSAARRSLNQQVGMRFFSNGSPWTSKTSCFRVVVVIKMR